MSHKQVEQHRRLKAKLYFEELRAMIPAVDARSDRNKVLAVAIDHIKNLKGIPIAPGSRACDRAGLRGDQDDEDMMFEMDDAQKMSHNVVEQRRRHLAKGYFDELRDLLTHPQAAKFDKNTVLQHTVSLLKRLQSGHVDSSDSVSRGETSDGGLDGHQHQGSLSGSPTDVTSFAAAFSAASKPPLAKREGEAKRGKKRQPEAPKARTSSPSAGSSDQDIFEMEGLGVEAQDHKRSRHSGCAAGDGSGRECPCSNCEAERECLSALSLLAEVALSVPNTPVIAPGAGPGRALSSPVDMQNLVLSA
mmetsp:Transcript_14950/g.38028  ORF Transcript_14950/g.38028 Transcript_14950/m.38028 type:complete len:304 (+) Transcript_14950:200-1111(+)